MSEAIQETLDERLDRVEKRLDELEERIRLLEKLSGKEVLQIVVKL